MGRHKRNRPWNRRAESGQRAWKRVTFRIVPPEGHPDLEGTIVQKAQAGMCYTQASVDEMIEKMIDRLDKRFPHWEFEMVKVGDSQFNFVYAGLRESHKVAATAAGRAEESSGYPSPSTSDEVEHGINDEEYPQ